MVLGTGRIQPRTLQPVPAPSSYRPAPSLDAAERGGHALQVGQQGPAVSALQQHLNRAGAQPTLAVDGLFGSATDQAVRIFQQRNGLQVDGKAGPQTLRALRSGASFEPQPTTRDRNDAVSSVGGSASREAPSTAPLPDPLTRTRAGLEARLEGHQGQHHVDLETAVRQGAVVQRGDRGPAVGQLQQRLSALGYGVGQSNRFGAQTESQLKNFQAAQGVEQTGKVGPTTLDAIERVERARQVSASAGARALDTPVLDQHSSGSYPGGYCAITALRMTLRLEGKTDPGADAVALGGAHPYSPGSGSSGSLLAARARELGLADARYTTTGSLDDVKAELARGHAVPIGGEGRFVGTYADGSGRVWDHSYRGGGHWMTAVGYDAERRRFVVNDPDRGARMYVDEADFARFFTPDGPGTAWMIRY